MGLILDLAVAALALIVIGSLALLAWTLAVPGVRAAHRAQRRVALQRTAVAAAETRIRASAAGASAALDELARRTSPAATDASPSSGDPPDA